MSSSASSTRLASATRSLIPRYSSSPMPPLSSQTSPTPFLPVMEPVQTRITIVAVVVSCSLILLISVLLVLLLYFIAEKMKSERLKRYSSFHREEISPAEGEIEQIHEDSKYNPMYISDSLRGRDSLCDEDLKRLLRTLAPGREVQATQDYFQPGKESEDPIFFKGDTILILKLEEEVHRGQTIAWLRGEVGGREVCFPSYVVSLFESLEDTFDTLSTPVRDVPSVDGLTAQDSAVSVDSAPAELESLFHDVDFTLHTNALPLLSRPDLAKQRHSSHSDISREYKPIMRPTRRPPSLPSIPMQSIPCVPSKLNRPKLSSRKSGSKDTDELLFVPPPLSSSTPLRHPESKPGAKRTQVLIPRRQRRPDTPDVKIKPKSNVPPSSQLPSWLVPMDPPPSRPDPPYTPSTLSLLLYAESQDEVPVKPPPPSSLLRSEH